MRRAGLGIVLLAAACSDTGSSAPTGDEPPHPPETIGFFAPAGALVSLPGAGQDGGEGRFMTTRAARARASPFAIAGDFDGDGLDTVGVYDLVGNVVHLRNANDEGGDDASFVAGEPGDLPLVGDFDGDGVDTLGLFSLASGRFTLLQGNDAGAGRDQLEQVLPLGLPLAANLEGQGPDQPGVYDAAARTFRFASGSGERDVPFDVGTAEVLPFAGDFDGDGIDELGLAEPGSRLVHVRSGTLGTVEVTTTTRAFDWQPLAGRWKPAASTLLRDGYAWPEAGPASVGVDPGALEAGLDWAETRPFLHGVLVVRQGALVAERYANDFRATDPQCIKSVSKSILSALFGIAYRRGEVTPETLVADVLPEYFEGQEPGKRAITVAHLLTMSAGLAWEENTPEYMDPFVVADDWAAFVLAQPLLSEPGTVFEYSSGLTHVGARVLERLTGRRLSEYAAEHLFAPLGIEPQRWDRDTQDRDVGGWEVWMPPRDLARFGQLYLDGGSVGGVEIVPPEWIAGTTLPLVASDYGGWWWVRDTLGHPTYYAWGWGGQFVFVIDDLDLVVVVTSEWWDDASLDAAYEQAFTLLDDYVVPAALP